ncbi:kelch domain-containing protein 7A [Onychostruthus taczanowskii]|uniref:kelch domain-containing protein 7A n=1 Tax=Onychostruthus taczanowskii TaxID=356909 RepID=UPI001B80CA3D|nr:kelch domain-containing protein 7A [Onychostruthus taczanowskii]
MPQRVPPAWHSDMQLPGKLLLSAAALLLLSLAFRFYRNRSPPPGKIPPGEQRENRDGDGALRRRRRDGGDKSGNGPGMRHAALWGEKSFPRNEEEEEKEEEEGEEVGSELIPRKAPLGPVRIERELGGKRGWKLGIKSVSEAGVELGSDPRSRTGSELGKEPGSKLGSQPGRKPGSKLITKPGIESGSEQTNELGNKLGNKLGIKSGIELGSNLESKLESETGIEGGSESGILLGSDLGSKAGVKVGSEPGISLGSELGSHDPAALARAWNSPAGREEVAPSSGRSPGIPDARTEGDGCAQSTEQDPAGAGRSREGSTGTVRTLSVTSSLGLLLTASEAGSDTSYCFSSVAKIQVEENFIPERRDKDWDSPPRPGLRGKVYDYFMQSTSESVSRRTSLPFVPAGTSQRRRERDQAEPQSSGTQGENPALEIPDPNSSSAPQEGMENPPEPSSPGWKGSTLGIAPLLPLPGGVPAAGPELSQVSPPGQVHLGNCSEVLRVAKARQLRALQDAALQVMSNHLLQVLRSPAIYGRLNAGERELLPALRSRGRPRLVVADVPPAEPGHRRGRLCYYDEDGDRWCQLCQLPAEVAGRGCAVCSMFNYLFVVPGWEGMGHARSPSRRVLCYDPLGDSWHDVCPLLQARPRCQLVALDGHLYAIGGECLATVERYDPRRDRWAFTAALPRDTFAVAHAATACDGDIYVTGGTLRSLLLRYDARGDSWATSPSVGDKDRTAELVSAHGFLYRFQLRRGTGGAEVAVSRCSASARLWYRCGSHPLPEPAGLRCAALGGLVHCLGRGFHLRFLADPVSPRFGNKELRPFPGPHGSLLPAVLVLPEGGTEPPQP